MKMVLSYLYLGYYNSDIDVFVHSIDDVETAIKRVQTFCKDIQKLEGIEIKNDTKKEKEKLEGSEIKIDEEDNVENDHENDDEMEKDEDAEGTANISFIRGKRSLTIVRAYPKRHIQIIFRL